MSRSIVTVLSAALVGTASVVPGPASAAETPTAETQGLEEVVVTATKRNESIQDVPISITAVNSAQMQRLGMTSLTDVSLRVPGLNYTAMGDLKFSPTSLRGVYGGAGSAGADPAVGTYVDEVFTSQGAGNTFDLFDIERVEVLRGPQGTLFGRNTIGGVINVVTRRPTESFTADAELTYGNYDYVRVGALVSGPLGSDRLLGKISATYNDRAGRAENLTLNRDTNDQHNWSTRGQLLYRLDEDSELLLTGDYTDVDQSTISYDTLRYNNAATLPNVIDLFRYPRNTSAFDRKVYGDQPNVETLEMWGAALNFSTKVGGADMTAIASYRTHDYYNRADTERSPVAFLYDGDPENVDRYSGEVRFDWTTGALKWLAGVYLYDQKSTNLSFIEVGRDLASLLGAPGLVGSKAGSDATMTSRSYAGFAHLTWTVNDALLLMAGGRYTHEKKTIDYSQSDPLGLLGGDVALKADESWSQFTPTLTAQFRWNERVMTYATASQGFKSGGYNDALGDASNIAFDPEKLWNYEVGVKAELADRRFILNAAAYYMDWKDIQIRVDNPTTPTYDPITLNAGAASSTGFEADIEALPLDNLRIGLGVSVVDAGYEEGVLPSGKPLRTIPYAPKYTGNFNVEYRIPFAGGDLVMLGEGVMRGEAYLTQDNQPDGKQQAHELYNARLGYEASNGRWSVFLWGKNLTDKKVVQRLFDLYDIDVVGQKFVELNDPRTYGLTFRSRF